LVSVGVVALAGVALLVYLIWKSQGSANRSKLRRAPRSESSFAETSSAVTYGRPYTYTPSRSLVSPIAAPAASTSTFGGGSESTAVSFQLRPQSPTSGTAFSPSSAFAPSSTLSSYKSRDVIPFDSSAF
jgi:hypothetical protein